MLSALFFLVLEFQQMKRNLCTSTLYTNRVTDLICFCRFYVVIVTLPVVYNGFATMLYSIPEILFPALLQTQT